MGKSAWQIGRSNRVSDRRSTLNLSSYKACPCPNDESTATVIESGDKATMKQRFGDYDHHAETLNGLGVDYGVVTDNSNSFWATMLRMKGKDPKQHLPRSNAPAPGTDDDLREWRPREPGNSTQP
jgi:hypothetical protein